MLRALLVTICLAGLAPLGYCQDAVPVAGQMPPAEGANWQETLEMPEATPQMYEESYGNGYVMDGSPALAANMTRLTWQHDLRTSLSKAKREQKLVLIDVYTDWCGWCKRLDRDVYSNARIAQYVDSQFVPLKMDAEDGGEGQEFARKHEIRGYPCTVVLDSNGQVKGMFYGYRKPNEFPAELAKAAGLQPNTPM
ncbi:MAG: thioredoxin family protein [Candidatus Obscuribacterales bacterium]|nr:thioredoxin family protein [Candidatus Obscuribacterales bacterium]